MRTLMGMVVRSSVMVPEAVPKFQVAPFVPMTDAGRADMNLWLKDRFGVEHSFLFFYDEIVAHPDTVRWLQTKLTDLGVYDIQADDKAYVVTSYDQETLQARRKIITRYLKELENA